MNTGATCQMQTHTCPCSVNTDCTACLEDVSSGCAWCENTEGGACTNDPEGCLVAHNCNTYCGSEGTTCDACVGLKDVLGVIRTRHAWTRQILRVISSVILVLTATCITTAILVKMLDVFGAKMESAERREILPAAL